MRRTLKAFVVLAMAAGMLASAAPAMAHDHRIFYEPDKHDVKANPIKGIAPTNPSAIADRVTFVDPVVTQQAQIRSSNAVLTRNPDTGLLFEPGFETPAIPCAPPVCSEIVVEVPKSDKPQTLYARAAWPLPNYYVHIWGISPVDSEDGEDVDCTYIPDDPTFWLLSNCDSTKIVYGNADVSDSFDKTTGNERTIPVSEFTVPDPAPGTWRIQTRAVFAYQLPVTTTVALSPGKALEYKRLGVRELADKYLTQGVDINIVFAGREWSEEEIATFRELMPAQYRPGVLSKQSDDCAGSDDNDTNPYLNWQVCHYSGTESPDAEGYRPYHEPIKFEYSYNFYQADDAWTKDLFAKAKDATTEDEAFDYGGVTGGSPVGTAMSEGDYLTLYDAVQGKAMRGPDHVVTNPTVSDKIDAFAVEDWIYKSRLDLKYAKSFKNLMTGGARDGRFISPDPAGYYDPFYTARGKKDLDTIPQGSATSYTFFIIDTFSPEYAAEYFRPNAYHHWDVSKRFIDPDTGEQDGPDWSRVWGGRYRFFFHDIGAAPNPYEAVDFFLGKVPGSASKPHGDPPIWEYENDPYWQGLLAERTARDVLTMLFYRFTTSYLYRPIPADVYFLASNNWSDCYSRPECSPDGIAHTILEKIYQPGYVEKNLAAALPGATFTTERSDPKLKTYRYLGCAANRVVSNNPNAQPVMVPDLNCTGESDPIQEVLELAKARGDDLVGAGVNDLGVSGNVVRAWVEAHRDEIAPLRPGQQTLTNISVVWPGATTWYLPAIVGGVALGTPNDEIWGILNNVNERAKASSATDCSKSSPVAPGCGIVPSIGGGGFSYTVQHEASHFLGLLHPHDSLLVEKDANGNWEYYGYSYRHYGDHSMAPTTYAGAFAPYSVLDQDIIQRGHTAEYLRMTEDWLSDAYLQDGMKGLTGPSALTRAKISESGKWKKMASQLFACGDALEAERAMRNAYLAAQGTFGPVVAPRPLKAGERVLFTVKGQRSFMASGKEISGCGASVQGAKVIGGKTKAPAGKPLPATGVGDGAYVALLCMAAAAAVLRVRRRTA